jgi:hypothetical protein
MVFGTVQDTHKKTKMEKLCVGFWDGIMWSYGLKKYGIMGFWPKTPPQQKNKKMFISPKRKTKELN